MKKFLAASLLPLALHMCGQIVVVPPSGDGSPGTVTAAQIAAAIQTKIGCTNAHYRWVPASNTCEAPDSGPTGAQGIQGVPGATGATGAAGTNGTNGATGAVGPTGPQGATGATGPAGSGGGGTISPNLTGVQTDSSGNTVQQTPDNAYGILSQDTLSPTTIIWSAGTHGDPCPVPISGQTVQCFNSGTIQISYNGSAYASIPLAPPIAYLEFLPGQSNNNAGDGPGGLGGFTRYTGVLPGANDDAGSVGKVITAGITIKTIQYNTQLLDCNVAVAAASGGGDKGLTIALYDANNAAQVSGTSEFWKPTGNFNRPPMLTGLSISLTAGHTYAVQLVGVALGAVCNTEFGASVTY